MAESKLGGKLFFSLISLALLFLVLYMVKTFIAALFMGAMMAFLAHPLYKKALLFMKSKSLASFAVTLSIILVVTVPTILVLGLLSAQAYDAYGALSEQNLGKNLLEVACGKEYSVMCKATQGIQNLLPEKNLEFYFESVSRKILSFVIDNASRLIVSVPSMLLNFFVMIFVTYYLLKDGEQITEKLKKLLPLEQSRKQELIGSFSDVTYGVFYGSIAVALIQGLLGGIGFAIFGVKSPFLWGAVMAFFAFVPYIGTAIIWLPASLNLIFTGLIHDSNSSVVRGIILIAYSLLFVSTIDNILKPRLIGKRANLHPILVLLGVLGGISMFGFLGIIIGPVMFALLITFFGIYDKRKSNISN